MFETNRLTEDALEGVVDVINQSRRGLPLERSLSVEEFRVMTFRDPDFRVEGSWFVKSGGVAVAYALVLVEANRLAIGRDDAFVDLEVIPESRGSGLEQMLMERALAYIRSRGVGKARVRCHPEDSWRKALLVSGGFAEASRVYTLVRKGRDGLPTAPIPEGIRLVRRPYKDCDDEEITRITEAFNATFHDHYNFAPERPEKFIEYRDVSKDPMIISLAMAGDEIAGVCLCDESLVYNEENDAKSGWVGILGVIPSYRKKGVGRVLLIDGMSWVLDRGMDTVFINVYASNEKALTLYRSVGFEKLHEGIWFEKKLR